MEKTEVFTGKGKTPALAEKDGLRKIKDYQLVLEARHGKRNVRLLSKITHEAVQKPEGYEVTAIALFKIK